MFLRWTFSREIGRGGIPGRNVESTASSAARDFFSSGIVRDYRKEHGTSVRDNRWFGPRRSKVPLSLQDDIRWAISPAGRGISFEYDSLKSRRYRYAAKEKHGL